MVAGGVRLAVVVRRSGKRGVWSTGLSLTYAVATPWARIVSVITGWWSQIGLKPGTEGIPAVRRQLRKG